MRDLVDGGAAVDFQDALHSGRASQSIAHTRSRRRGSALARALTGLEQPPAGLQKDPHIVGGLRAQMSQPRGPLHLAGLDAPICHVSVLEEFLLKILGERGEKKKK